MPTKLYLTPADEGRRVSLEEFLSASWETGYRYELIHGRIAVAPAPAFSHDWMQDWLKGLLDQYARDHPEVINRVSGRARVFQPEPEEGPTAPEPALACYSGIDFSRPVEEIDWDDISPVLVAEVVSADAADKDLDRNVGLYLRVPSIREYWILDPRRGSNDLTLLAYRRRGQRWTRPRTVRHGEEYTTPLLPGFTLLLDPYA